MSSAISLPRDGKQLLEMARKAVQDVTTTAKRGKGQGVNRFIIVKANGTAVAQAMAKQLVEVESRRTVIEDAGGPLIARLRTYVEHLVEFSDWLKKPTSTFSTTRSLKGKLETKVEQISSCQKRVLHAADSEGTIDPSLVMSDTMGVPNDTTLMTSESAMLRGAAVRGEGMPLTLKEAFSQALAYMYGIGATEKNYNKAVELLTTAATAGHVESMLELSKLRFAVQDDNAGAYQWLSKAVAPDAATAQVSGAAQVALALHLRHISIPSESRTQASLLQSAIDKKCPEASAYMGRLLLAQAGPPSSSPAAAAARAEQCERAVENFVASSSAGSVEGAACLGLALLEGVEGAVQPNVERAVVWLELAATAGHAGACLTLGRLAESVAKKESWFKAGAMASRLDLGQWERHPASNWSAACKGRLGRLYVTQDNDGSTAAFRQGLAMLADAADGGHVPSMFWLGQAYERGFSPVATDPSAEAVSADRSGALRQYLRAFSLGHVEAGLAAAHVTFHLDGAGLAASRHTASAEAYWRVVLTCKNQGYSARPQVPMVGDEAEYFSYDGGLASRRGGVAVLAEACNALGLLLESGAGTADGNAIPHVAASFFLAAATAGLPQAWLNLLPLLSSDAMAGIKVIPGPEGVGLFLDKSFLGGVETSSHVGAKSNSGSHKVPYVAVHDVLKKAGDVLSEAQRTGMGMGELTRAQLRAALMTINAPASPPVNKTQGHGGATTATSNSPLPNPPIPTTTAAPSSRSKSPASKSASPARTKTIKTTSGTSGTGTATGANADGSSSATKTKPQSSSSSKSSRSLKSPKTPSVNGVGGNTPPKPPVLVKSNGTATYVQSPGSVTSKTSAGSSKSFKQSHRGSVEYLRGRDTRLKASTDKIKAAAALLKGRKKQ